MDKFDSEVSHCIRRNKIRIKPRVHIFPARKDLLRMGNPIPKLEEILGKRVIIAFLYKATIAISLAK